MKNGAISEADPWIIETADGTRFSICPQKRKSTWANRKIKVSGSKVRVGAGGCIEAALESYSKEQVRSEWQKLPDDLCKKRDGSGYKDMSDDFILHFVDHPMLFIHYLYITDEKDVPKYPSDECKVIALGLGFPSNDDYEEGKRSDTKRKKIKVYLNVIAQELSDEEGDDVVNEDL